MLQGRKAQPRRLLLLSVRSIVLLTAGAASLYWYRSAHAPVPGWFISPPGCEILISRNALDHLWSWGPEYYLRMRCPHDPHGALNRIYRSLKFGGAFPPRPMSQNDIKKHNSSGDSLHTYVMPIAPGDRAEMMEVEGNRRKAVFTARSDGDGCVVELIESFVF